jgi:hypothetical protein
LGWKSDDKSGNSVLRFRRDEGKPVKISLQEREGEPIGRCVLRDRAKEFSITHAAGVDLLEVFSGAEAEKGMHQFMPAGENDPVVLMNEELVRGGPHRIYLRALDCVRDFF